MVQGVTRDVRLHGVSVPLYNPARGLITTSQRGQLSVEYRFRPKSSPLAPDRL